MNRRLETLTKIYALYDDFSAGYHLACHKGCDRCCTANVVLTTLEGALIMRHWQSQGQPPPHDVLQAAARNERFQPTLTINGIAALCLQNQDIPEETADPAAGPCPLLQEGYCAIYTARPFGCRAMVSRSRCQLGGAAEMPDEILSANHLVLQYIEALDVPGWSGNLTDILRILSDPRTGHDLQAGESAGPSQGLTANRAIPVLMVPPEYRARLQPLIQAINGYFKELKVQRRRL